jgi:hypothetical protein
MLVSSQHTSRKNKRQQSDCAPRFDSQRFREKSRFHDCREDCVKTSAVFGQGDHRDDRKSAKFDLQFSFDQESGQSFAEDENLVITTLAKDEYFKSFVLTLAKDGNWLVATMAKDDFCRYHPRTNWRPRDQRTTFLKFARLPSFVR